MSVRIEPFEFPVDAAAVAALRDRLAAVTIPEDSPGAAAVSGMPMSRLAGLVTHWREGFDWSAQVARLNALPQIMATLDGQRVHAVVAPG